MDYYEDEPHRAFADQPRGSISGRAVAYIAPVLVAGAMLGGYAYHEHRVAEDLAQQNQQNTAALATTRTQVDDLNAKVNALAAEAAEPKPAPAPNPPMRKLATSHHPAQPSRLQKMQAQLDAQNQQIADTRNQIASTQNDLSNTRTELTGSIAHTHDELVLLEKKGERSYFEFDLSKAKTYQREGPFGVKLPVVKTVGDNLVDALRLPELIGLRTRVSCRETKRGQKIKCLGIKTPWTNSGGQCHLASSSVKFC